MTHGQAPAASLCHALSQSCCCQDQATAAYVVNARPSKLLLLQPIDPQPVLSCMQGIASDVKRTEVNEGDADLGRVKHDDPNLVAYWTFEEGSGYLVKDVTGRGHDLHIQQPPQWRVSFHDTPPPPHTPTPPFHPPPPACLLCN